MTTLSEIIAGHIGDHLPATAARGCGRYLVAEVSYVNCGSQPASYALRGHPCLGTAPGSVAWKAHEDLHLIELPGARSWAMLKEAAAHDQASRNVSGNPTRG